jgi:hypothetical protein
MSPLTLNKQINIAKPRADSAAPKAIIHRAYTWPNISSKSIECTIKFKFTANKAISIQINVTIKFLRFKIIPNKDKTNKNKQQRNN